MSECNHREGVANQKGKLNLKKMNFQCFIFKGRGQTDKVSFSTPLQSSSNQLTVSFNVMRCKYKQPLVRSWVMHL